MPSEQTKPSYDSRADRRDILTSQLIIASLQGGAVAVANDYVDDCRRLAKYIQDTNEEGENKDNHYWGDWVCRKTDEVLDLIADAITKGRLS